MNKIASIALALAVAISGQLISASSQEREKVSLQTTNIDSHENENIKVSKDTVSTDFLGSKLKSDTVFATSDQLFENDRLRSNSVEIFLGGLLIGWLIDGIIIYVSGYSGAVLAAATIGMIISFVAAHPVILVSAVTVLLVTASSIQKYKTNNGNECVLQPSGNGYYCKYNLEDTVWA
ncbi:MAG: hypothetical protein ACRCZJ_00825 [Erysipelotrichaceae bacterium]